MPKGPLGFPRLTSLGPLTKGQRDLELRILETTSLIEAESWNRAVSNLFHIYDELGEMDEEIKQGAIRVTVRNLVKGNKEKAISVLKDLAGEVTFVQFLA